MVACVCCMKTMCDVDKPICGFRFADSGNRMLRAVVAISVMASISGCKTKSNSPEPNADAPADTTAVAANKEYNADCTAPLPSEAAGYLIISCWRATDEGLAHLPALRI